MEARFPVAQHVAELQLQRAGEVFADQFAQVALPGDEADQRNRPVSVAGLDQLDKLGALAADEADIGRPAGQPQDQLVEEQDHRVVAERVSVAADDAQAVVERHEGLAAALGDIGDGREVAADQVADQAHAVVPARRLEHRGFEARRIPAAAQLTPAAVSAAAVVVGIRPRVQIPEESLVAEAIAHAHRVFKKALRQVEARDRRLRMALAHELGVAAEDRRLHAARADHVIRHEQEPALLRPAVVLSDDVGQLGHRARRHVVVEQQVEHGHEVALARAETAVQVRGLAGAALDRLLDEVQRIVEAGVELRCHHVVAQRRFSMCHALGQLEDEVALVHALRDGDQVFQQRHRMLPFRRPAPWGRHVVQTNMWRQRVKNTIMFLTYRVVRSADLLIASAGRTAPG
ncbi:MAG: hypothetical protein AW10_01317 [Candidatus Accumulibacter appositus]|uniref:Uncharacterized protein n=1 Tax=Candidatus Accumulibacter appositus TaxID=1454003 RepID=A0A011NF38_9PROT|nr:MAG: hypothetical protein AW10_01317 [Candidatus Accumulibacter appositus]